MDEPCCTGVVASAEMLLLLKICPGATDPLIRRRKPAAQILGWRNLLIRRLYIAGRKEQDDLEFARRGHDRSNCVLLSSTRFSSRLARRSTTNVRSVRSANVHASTEFPCSGAL